MPTLTISNRMARRLWLDRQGLAGAPIGALDKDGLLEIVRKIGFVQLDTIRVIARAHDHILWSRNQNYRENMLDDLVKGRDAFEHFTHDASVLPMEFYPYWNRQFGRMRAQIEKRQWRDHMPSKNECDQILKRIADEGSLSTKAFDAQKGVSRKEGWARPPHKFALDYYWYIGTLATCHRRNFIKHYNLTENVIPTQFLKKSVSDAAQINWLCENALSRLGFGSEGDIQRFWDAAHLDEVKGWTTKNRNTLVNVEVQTADGGVYKALAPLSLESQLNALKAPTSRLRILNPFDPVIRDRARLQRLFGFDYRIEIFVPAAKRQYGYYVYPLLEGDRFVGRIEVRADRKANAIKVENLWWEPNVKATKARLSKLASELERIGRFIGARDLVGI